MHIQGMRWIRAFIFGNIHNWPVMDFAAIFEEIFNFLHLSMLNFPCFFQRSMDHIPGICQPPILCHSSEKSNTESKIWFGIWRKITRAIWIIKIIVLNSSGEKFSNTRWKCLNHTASSGEFKTMILINRITRRNCARIPIRMALLLTAIIFKMKTQPHPQTKCYRNSKQRETSECNPRQPCKDYQSSTLMFMYLKLNWTMLSW